MSILKHRLFLILGFAGILLISVLLIISYGGRGRESNSGIEKFNIDWDIPMDQFTDPLSLEIAIAIKEAVYQNEMLTNTETIKVRKELNQILAIQELEIEGDWAFCQGVPKDKTTSQTISTEPMPLLAHKINSHWEIVHPTEEKFFQWLSFVPESLLSSDIKEYFIMQYRGE